VAKKKKYPADFVKRAKAEYPDWAVLHRALDSGNEFVGRYLDDSSSGNMNPNKVILMID